jgi:multicomponent K+:H+ antiporter subunit D
MVSSTLTIAAFFLLIELVERGQDAAANVLAVTIEAYGDEEEEEEEEVGAVLPATLAILGACFAVSAILLIGLPPFSGFVAKISLLSALFNPAGMGTDTPISTASWVYVALIILSGVAALIAMSRSGIRTFWASMEGNVPRVLVIELVPVAALLFLCLALTIQAAPVMRYLDATAQALHRPHNYIDHVLDAKRSAGFEPMISTTPAAKGDAQ